MKRLWCVLAAVLLAAVAIAGCGGSDNPFTGSWIAATGDEITFASSTWESAGGDAGNYSYTGADPTYTLTMSGKSGTRTLQATFLDGNTLRFCDILGSGALFNCVELVRDKPTVPSR